MCRNGAIGAEANGDLPAHKHGAASGAARWVTFGAASLAALLTPALAFAQDAAPVADKGDTAWMLTSSVLVLMMTVPGLALFYAGLVRVKNSLSVMVQCVAITCLMSVLWLLGAYSLVALSNSELLGVRDPLGVRPLILGRIAHPTAGPGDVAARSVAAGVARSSVKDGTRERDGPPTRHLVEDGACDRQEIRRRVVDEGRKSANQQHDHHSQQQFRFSNGFQYSPRDKRQNACAFNCRRQNQHGGDGDCRRMAET